MLTLFYFVRTVGGALIKAGRLTRRQAAMANTSIGWQAASSKWLMGEVVGSRGAAGWRHCLTMGGVVLTVGLVGLPAVDRWHLWWCVGCCRRHCQWDSDWTGARRKRYYRKIWFRQENVYVRKNQKHVTHWVIRCAKKHCRCNNNENDAQGSRDLQKICSSQRNVYLRRNEDVTLWTFRFEI